MTWLSAERNAVRSNGLATPSVTDGISASVTEGHWSDLPGGYSPNQVVAQIWRSAAGGSGGSNQKIALDRVRGSAWPTSCAGVSSTSVASR